MKSAGDEMTAAVETTLSNTTQKSMVCSSIEYDRIEESRKKQIAACQQLRAFSMLNYEAHFMIRATLRASKEEALHQREEYKSWKEHRSRYGRVF